MNMNDQMNVNMYYKNAGIEFEQMNKRLIHEINILLTVIDDFISTDQMFFKY